MTAASTYLEDNLLNHVLRNTAYTSPTTVYAALFFSGVSDADLENNAPTNEVTGGSYARQPVTFTAPTDGVVSNTAAVTFSDMPAGTVTHVAITDTVTGGNAVNVLYYAALTASKTVANGDTLSFATGDLVVTLQ